MNEKKYDVNYDYSDDCKCEEYRNDKEVLHKYLVYKFSDGVYAYQKVNDFIAELAKYNGITTIKDPDSGSDELQEVYKKLYEKYISGNEDLFIYKGKIQGETMNSVQTILGRWLKLILETKRKRPNFEIRGKKESLGCFASCYLSHTEFISVELEKRGGRDFVRRYHTLGNFIMIPVGCNGPRGDSAKIKDFWDLTLACIYNYYAEKDGKKKLKKKEEAVYCLADFLSGEKKKNYETYLNLFGTWDGYVEANFMQPFLINEGKKRRRGTLWTTGTSVGKSF